MSLEGNETSAVVSGLDEYTVYNFTLYASTRIGDGPATNILGRTNESCKFTFIILLLTLYAFLIINIISRYINI